MPKQSPSRFTMVPLRRSSEPTATRRARTIMVAAALAALTGPLAIGVSFLGLTQEVDFSEVDPQGRGIADAAAYQTMSDSSVKIPTARSFDPESLKTPKEAQGPEAVQLPYEVDSLTWTGFEVNTFVGNELETKFEVHRYLLVPDVDDYVGKYLEANGGRGAPTDEAEEDVDGGNTSGSTEEPAEEATEEPDAEGEAPAEELPADPETDMSEQEEILEQGVTPYQLEVPVLITEEGPRLAGAPSIAPWTDAEAGPKGDADYSNYGNLRIDANSQTARQVGRWAVAYAENDGEALLTVTGDSNTDHQYVGLGGWTVPDASSSVQILQAISVNEGNQLLRVRVLLEDDRTDAESNENRHRIYTDYDVLVTNPDSATPQIVAWGAAGSGASLTPYKNAITK